MYDGINYKINFAIFIMLTKPVNIPELEQTNKNAKIIEEIAKILVF